MKPSTPMLLSILIPLAAIGCGGGGGAARLVGTTTPGSFSSTGSMAYARSSHQAVLLTSGKVLVAGGATSATTGELYDPSLGTFAPANNAMTAPRRESLSATLLGSGKVLIAGGLGSSPLASAELFDPAVGTFASTASLATARYGHTGTLLGNGKVLIAGGGYSSTELYDPLAGTFSVTGSMSAVRSYHTATLLTNGKVLIAGGQLGSGSAIATAELYDPSTGTFAATGSMAMARRAHTATLLTDGTVLITGGGTDNSGTTIASSAELYTPATGTFTTTGSMKSAREAHTATMLSSGKVLLIGGHKGSGSADYLASAEVYDPTSKSFTLTSGNLLQARDEHTATLLTNGKVLVTGGGNASSSFSSAELFQ